jgi:hypothetical protein
MSQNPPTQARSAAFPDPGSRKPGRPRTPGTAGAKTLKLRRIEQARSRGLQSDASTGMAARPAERRSGGSGVRPLAPASRQGDGFGASGLAPVPPVPSTHARGQGGADCGEAGLRYPARHGGQAGQASSGRRRRPSRAFFAPKPDDRSWPSGVSPDALLLLSHPRAARRHEDGGVHRCREQAQTSPRSSSCAGSCAGARGDRVCGSACNWRTKAGRSARVVSSS